MGWGRITGEFDAFVLSPPFAGAVDDSETTCGRFAPSSVVRPLCSPLPGRRSHRGKRSVASRRLRAQLWRGRSLQSAREREIFFEETKSVRPPPRATRSAEVSENPGFLSGLSAEARPAEVCKNPGFWSGLVAEARPVVHSAFPVPSAPSASSATSSSPPAPGDQRGAVGTTFLSEHPFSCRSAANLSRESHGSVSPRDGSGDNSSHGRIGQSSLSTPSISDNFTVFHLNVRGLRENRAVFDAFLSTLGKPTFVAVTETWLDKTTETLDITGYHRVSRLDRRGRARSDRGGVALYALDGFELTIVHVGDSTTDERSWHIIHSDSGPVLLCVWYRPPMYGEVESIRRFEQEFQEYSKRAVSAIVVGDMNVHNVEWLTFSNGTKPEGRELENVCSETGLVQLVRGPTRGDHLLDLVLSDFGSGIRSKVTPGIHDNDHRGVLTTVSITVQASEPVRRKVYDYNKADWDKLRKTLADKDWQAFFSDLGAGDSASALTNLLLTLVDSCIPSRWITDKAFAHPWLNDACREALRLKHLAVGTADFVRRRDECTETFLRTYNNHVAKVRNDLRKLSPSSKGWWKLSGSLLTKATGQENIPPLQKPDDSWAISAEDKAKELARVFQSKSTLPPPHTNRFSPVEPPCSEQMPGFLRLRVRTVKKILKSLDEHSGTGPDHLPSRVLKRCATELALPVTMLTRKMLSEGSWPHCWRTHWVQAIHKRDSKAQGKNYRGVHLTPQLSKVVERAIGSLLVPWLEQVGAFGPHQYAYTKGRGYKDVLAINVCSWLLAMEQGLAVAIYASDVSGAFDRVSKTRLGEKLQRLGLHPGLLSLLNSWLEDRVSEVVVGGRCSVQERLADSVFQGTVLGSPVWNVFYADARYAVNNLGWVETVFADDFNAWKTFRPSEAGVRAHQCKAQHDLHDWGWANRVLFDPTKESFHTLHRAFFEGENFKILGCLFDPQLLMHAACRMVATEAGWRLRKLLRSRQFFTTPELMHLYKAQILSYIESSTPGVYHAAPSVLERVDRVQLRLLRELEMDELSALCDYRLAPLPARRDMAMLGVLHKVTLGRAPAQLAALFPPGRPAHEPLQHFQRLRHWRPLHNKQLHSHAALDCTEVMRRSLFGLVKCYNQLPQRVVDSASVTTFQKLLQAALKKHALRGRDEAWGRFFTQGWRPLTRAALDELFS